MTNFVPGAAASTVLASLPPRDAARPEPAPERIPEPVPEPAPEYVIVRHLIFSTLAGIQTTIKTQHRLGYAEPNDWSPPVATGRPDEVMAFLVKRIRVA